MRSFDKRIGLGASGVSATYRGTERGDRITQHAVPKTSTKYGPHVLKGAGLADCWLYARFSVDGFVGLGVLARTV